MKLCTEIRKNTYYDSVTLMLITKEIKKMTGIREVIVGLGTELNKELTVNLSISTEQINNLTPNDFFIAVLCEEENIMKEVVEKVEGILSGKGKEQKDVLKAKSLDSAFSALGEANITVISLPGKYAAHEAKRALMKGLHVMLFSDNVSIEEEIELKTLGREKGLLVMGPDCGTAIINQVPLCFANVVAKGDIGIVGASGTGTQEVTVLIDRFGGGVSQVIGTGGRDLKSQVGGIMMLEGLKALADDPQTKVIVLISKPPAPEVAQNILNTVKDVNKPVVVNFIGGDRKIIEEKGGYSCISLEDAAFKAVALSKGIYPEDFSGFSLKEEEINNIVHYESSKLKKVQKYLRAFYTGGTLADETMKLLSREGYELYSNIPLVPELKLSNVHRSLKHTCIDLGDDDFTLGKPHPMIDPVARVERLVSEADDEEIAVILMDFVLGYGSNLDPACEMLPAIIGAKEKAERRGGHLCVIGYICGTEKDPQDYNRQKNMLEKAGVVLMPSNAQAVKLAAKILKRIEAH